MTPHRPFRVALSTGGLAAAAACTLFVSCGPSGRTNHYRPVGPLARPTEDDIARLRVDQTVPTASVVAMLDASQGRAARPRGTGSGGSLVLDDVMRSVENRFPLILAALEEVEIAAGMLQSADGGFDTRLTAKGEVAAQGFYENEQAGLGLEQPLEAWGATLFTGYKLGRGDFAIWDGDLKSNRDGEVRAGVRIPLLAGREIDSRRLGRWQARIERAQADPVIRAKRLEATRKAALSYWKWVAAGQKLRIAERLLALATNRQSGIEEGAAAGELPGIAVDDNQRLVVDRQSIVIQSERAVQEAAIFLSLYLRDADGNPQLPTIDDLPESLPAPSDPALLVAGDDIQRALRLRPELQSLRLDIRKMELDLAKAQNELLPKLDLQVAGSQDLGDAVSDPDDKGPFEFDALVSLAVPVHRNAARGKQRSVTAKKRQLEYNLTFAGENVVAEVRDAESALRQSWLRIAAVRENVRLAGKLEAAEREALASGESNLLQVNLRERQTASAASSLIDVVSGHFSALANYRASVGVSYDEALK